ncbi:MAG: H-type lectin domain-containing protein [Paracoccaceae bacterium]|nr:H-type lectin domain-containing protein [Paracoccaceae bacterium]
MIRLTGQTIAIDQGSLLVFDDYETNGEMWTGTGKRERRIEIRFAASFRGPPAVQVSLAMWDVHGGTNQRGDLGAEVVTERGFQLVFRTWDDTRVARIRANWIAIGEVPDEDDWDV